MAEAAAQTKARPVDERHFPRAKDETTSVELRMKEYVNSQGVEDPFEAFYATGVGSPLNIITPPYNLYALAKLPYENSMLLQCIAAMVENCDGHGHALEYIGPKDQQTSAAAVAEKATIEKLFKYPNPDYSFHEMRKRLRFDYENCGNCYMEAPRDRKGRVASLWHIPAQTLRRTMRDVNLTTVEVKLPRDGSDTSTIQKRFCRFVQVINEKRVYFKEWGDPRVIDPTTGEENTALPPDQQATEIIHRFIYYPVSPYGVPRWINQLPSILGSRQAELTNLDFFKDNAIPAMAVMVAGGQLTAKTLENIEDQLGAIKGRKATHRMVFIEATGDENMASDNGAIAVPKVTMQSLRGAQQSDALFQEYESDCEDKTRSSFRLPPLFVGLSEDMTYATAQTSYDVAEGQVFGPERRGFDEVMDGKILSSYDIKFWAFRSNPAKITDHDSVVNALTAFNSFGALTPNVAIKLANEYFDLEIDEVSEDWGNWPFDIVKLIAQSGQLKGADEITDQVDTGLQGAGLATHDVFGKPVPAEGSEPAKTGPDGKPVPDQPDPKAPVDKTPAGQKKPKPNAVPSGASAKKDDQARLYVGRALMDLRNILKGEPDALAA